MSGTFDDSSTILGDIIESLLLELSARKLCDQGKGEEGLDEPVTSERLTLALNLNSSKVDPIRVRDVGRDHA